MRTIACFLAGLALAGVLCAGTPGEVAEAEQSVAEKRARLARKQQELRDLAASAETLETTAAVTLDPAAKPSNEAREPEVVYRNALSSLDGFKGAKGTAQVVDLPDGGKAVRIDSPGAESIAFVLPVPEGGATLRVTVRMKAENVVQREAKRFNGTRLGAYYRLDGKSHWPAAPAQTGTFDWRGVSFQFTAPGACENVRLILGMAGAEGTVFVRDLVVEKL